MNKPAIIIENISKSYGKTIALQSIDFSVNKGEIFGVIGPDGAGKTTLFRLITTLLVPDSGKITVFENDTVSDYKKIRKNTGYMPGRFSLYQDLTVEENLNFFATAFGTTLAENYYLIKDIYGQIEPYKHRLAGKLSGGMKQKLALSCALIHKPDLLVLDEPTTGVDAVSRKEFWEMLRKLKENGITIIVSTPYMDEATLCDRVALIQGGKIMAIDSPENVTKLFTKKLYSIKGKPINFLLNKLRNYPDIHTAYLFGQTIHISFISEQFETNHLSEYLLSEHVENIEISQIEPGIEDCFMELMKN